MNAYELADELQKHGLNGDNYGLFNKRIQNMLRQQADRIAELEKEADRLSNHANELRKIHADRITEFEKENELLTAKLNYMFEQELKSARIK